ncbi:hypothetical protein D3C73_1204100 [compost metagenome]
MHRLGGSDGFKLQLDPWVASTQGIEHQRKSLHPNAGRHAHLHQAFTAGRPQTHDIDQVVAGGKQLSTFLHQRPSRRGQFRLPPAARDKVSLHARLQLLDMQADGRRRKV